MNFSKKRNIFLPPLLVVLIVSGLLIPVSSWSQDKYVQNTPQPKCFDYLQQAGICDLLATYAMKGYCTSPGAPSICVCSSSGNVIDSGVFCQETRWIDDPTDLASSPVVVMATPYEGAQNVAFYSGGHPLKFSLKPNAKLEQKGIDLNLCKSGCKKDMEWIIKKIPSSQIPQKYYIIKPGTQEAYLFRNKRNELFWVTSINRLSAEEKAQLEWFVGGGKFKDDQPIGYRILAANKPMEGLGVSNKTGQVGVFPLFEVLEVPSENEGEDSRPIFQLNADYTSLWQILSIRTALAKENRN